jgi:hypothetical protein
MESAHDLMHEFVRRTDSGRRLVSVVTLSAGGAIFAISVVGLTAALFAGKNPPELVDVVAGGIGAAISAAFLFSKFPIFADRESDIRKNRPEKTKTKHRALTDA